VLVLFSIGCAILSVVEQPLVDTATPTIAATAPLDAERDDGCSSSINAIGPITFSEVASVVANASPSTCILLANGTYSSGVILDGDGSAGAPIVVRAETPGQVKFTGAGRVVMRGSYVTVSGFDFLGGIPLSGVWREGVGEEIVDFDTVSGDHLRLTNSKIHDYTPGVVYQHWLQLSGTNHRIDHNEFYNKSDWGELLRVHLPSSQSNGRHRIDHNYFHDFADSGANGSEAIRLGSGPPSSAPSNTVIENNLFERLRGENEVISVKSSHTTIRHNTFRDNWSEVTFRAGNDGVFDGNIVIVNSGTGSGYRGYGDRQRVTNNQFFGVYVGLYLGAGTASGACYAPFRDGVVTGNRFAGVQRNNITESLFLGELRSGCTEVLNVPSSYAQFSDNTGSADISGAYTPSSPEIGATW